MLHPIFTSIFDRIWISPKSLKISVSTKFMTCNKIFSFRIILNLQFRIKRFLFYWNCSFHLITCNKLTQCIIISWTRVSRETLLNPLLPVIFPSSLPFILFLKLGQTLISSYKLIQQSNAINFILNLKFIFIQISI